MYLPLKKATLKCPQTFDPHDILENPCPVVCPILIPVLELTTTATATMNTNYYYGY